MTTIDSVFRRDGRATSSSLGAQKQTHRQALSHKSQRASSTFSAKRHSRKYTGN
jgi:hypothetical protein